MAKAKKFEELTPVGQKRRLALYEKKNADERAKLQKEYAENHDGASIELHDDLATLARPAKQRENSNGSKTAIMTIGILNPESKKMDWKTATVYLRPKDNTKFEDFITSLKGGDLLSVRYVVNDHGTLNIWNVFKRERKQKEDA